MHRPWPDDRVKVNCSEAGMVIVRQPSCLYAERLHVLLAGPNRDLIAGASAKSRNPRIRLSPRGVYSTHAA